MQFSSTIALFAVIGAVIALPGGGSGSQCTAEQANKCCTGLTDGLLNLNVLSALCLPLVGNCNNQAACCESSGLGVLNCLTVQV